MITKEEYITLYEKYLSGVCSPEEIIALEEYEDTFSFEEHPWDESAMGVRKVVKAAIRKRLWNHIRTRHVRKLSSIFHVRYSYVAAAAILLLIGFYWVITVNDSEGTIISEKSATIIAPGENKAVLELEDGTMVDLNSLQMGDVTVNGELMASKDGAGVVRYLSKDPDNRPRYQTIRTPNGGQFHVVLSDGTEVWLNAASSIRFPAVFDEEIREVEIEGEVYFDVKKQTERAFVVKSKQQEIIVTGTRFNVSCYPEERYLQTSLIEGSVTVNTESRKEILRPGERLNYDLTTREMKKDHFEEEEVLGWQDGNFVFRAEQIEAVMRKIGRWYDVEIVYDLSSKEKFFSGSISRFEQIEDVLEMLALTEVVSFKIEGRRVIVMD